MSRLSPLSRGHGAAARRVAPSVLVFVAIGASPAEATYPGRNAEILYEDQYGTDYTQEDLYSVCPNGRHEQNLGLLFNVGSGSFSPDGRSLALDGDVTIDTGSLWLFDARERGRRITRPGRRAADGGAVWSPHGGAIAFTRGRARSDAVRIYSNHHGRFLARGFGPAWSVRNQIAFTREERPGADDPEPWIYIVSARGGTPRRLVAGTAPDWSPDGRRLVFASRGYPNYEIGIADTSGKVRTLAAGTSASWSPNGSWIAFTTPTGYAARIAPSGKRSRLLARTGSAPMFSPDGRWVATARGADLYITRVSDGRRQYVTTAYSGEDLSPVTWRAAPAGSTRC